MNRRIQFLCVAAVLLATGTVGADLSVYEYVPGQKVTLDTNTGNYWYWDLDVFGGMTYAAQMSTIAGLGTYGNIDGGWHMATGTEMQALWDAYDAPALGAAFNPTLPPGLWMGRYDESWAPGKHFLAYTHQIAKGHLGLGSTYDSYASWDIGAWVTTDAPVVPVPGAVGLAATGLLTLLLGVNPLRRKR